MGEPPRIRRTERRLSQAQVSQPTVEVERESRLAQPVRPPEEFRVAPVSANRSAPRPVLPSSPPARKATLSQMPTGATTKKRIRWWAWAIVGVLAVVGLSSALNEQPPADASTQAVSTDAPVFTQMPTSDPAEQPTAQPTAQPTQSPSPTDKPSATPTPIQTAEPTAQPTAAPTPSPTPPPTPEPTSAYKTLNHGDTSDAVREMQTALYELGYLRSSDVVGRYGDKTKDAVRAFQSTNGLDADGIAGAMTLTVLYGGQALAAQEPTAKPAAKKSSGSVWIPTNGGTKYHRSSSCSNMDGPRKVSLEEAKRLGFTACQKCY